MDNITWLQSWYIQQCNGDWEHGYAVSIGTVDNPGWNVKIHLLGTRYDEVQNVELLKKDLGESDWIFCAITSGVFIGAGDAMKLNAILSAFRKWIESY